MELTNSLFNTDVKTGLMCCRIWRRHQAAFSGHAARRWTVVNFTQQGLCAARFSYRDNPLELCKGEFFLGFEERIPQTRRILVLFIAELYCALITLTALNSNPYSGSAFCGFYNYLEPTLPWVKRG